jgi:hypothetical protein
MPESYIPPKHRKYITDLDMPGHDVGPKFNAQELERKLMEQVRDQQRRGVPLLRRRRPQDIDQGRPPRPHELPPRPGELEMQVDPFQMNIPDAAPIQSPSEHRYEFGGKNFLTNLLSRNNVGPQS